MIVDDGDALGDEARAALKGAVAAGARLIWVGDHVPEELGAVGSEDEVFAVAPLDARAAAELVQRSVPSLPDALRSYLVERVGGRPGALRAAVRGLAGRVVVSKEDVDAALGATSRPSAAPLSVGRMETLEAAERALEMGRFDEAARGLDDLREPVPRDPPGLDDLREPVPRDPRGAEGVRVGIARARIALGRGDTAGAVNELSAIETSALQGASRRAWQAVRTRAHLRAGEYAEAVRLAQAVVDAGATDALAADALSSRGVALAFTGEDTLARAALEQAVRVARATGEARVEAVALGSAAIAHQRAGRAGDARDAYEASLSAAERARDAATVASTRLNLAGLAQAEGDLAQALVHLEAAVDMGRRAGSGAAVTQALLNLANLDLYLGRWARARGSIDQLVGRRDELSPAARAQLLGLEAEHATRTGDFARGAQLYEETARSWEAQGRTHDAAESRLEGLLARAREAHTREPADAGAMSRQLDAVTGSLGEGGLGEHAALAELARGAVAHVAGDEDAARRALDAGVDLARRAGRREWAWQALDARARLAAAQGSVATARRDTEVALAMLEETAAKLPRDLREVFWDDPRRRALRQAHTATMVAPSVLPPVGALVRSARDAREGAPPSSPVLAWPRTASSASSRSRASWPPSTTCRAFSSASSTTPSPCSGRSAASVLLMGDRGELEAHAARIRSGRDEPHARFSRSVAERVVQSGEPVVTMSARDDARLAEAVSVHQLMIQSIACVPIRGAPPARPHHRGALPGDAPASRRALRAGAAHAVRLRRSGGHRHRERAPAGREPRARRRAGRANVELGRRARRAGAPPGQTHRAARRRAPRSQASARRAAQPLRLRRPGGDQRGDAAPLCPHRSREGHRRPGADHRRERHRARRWSRAPSTPRGRGARSPSSA